MNAELPGWGGDIGGWLRREREARGIDLADISQKTRISQRWLELLERNRTDELPAEVFVRGFACSYARAVGADEKEAARLVASHYGGRAEKVEAETKPAACLRRRSLVNLGDQVPVALGVIALALALALFAALLFG